MTTRRNPQVSRRTRSLVRASSFGIASALALGFGADAMAAPETETEGPVEPGNPTKLDEPERELTDEEMRDEVPDVDKDERSVVDRSNDADADHDRQVAAKKKGDDDDDDRAQGADDARLRLHIDSEALGGTWVRVGETSDAPARDATSFGTGLARPSTIEGGAPLFSRPIIGFGLGYVFASERAVLGAKMALTVDGYDLTRSTRVTALGGRFVPYLHYMFLPDRWIRPYLEGRVGVGGSFTRRELPGDASVTGQVIYPIVGAGLGTHFFPRNWFSVDVGLNVDYASPYTRTTFDDVDEDDTDYTRAADVLNFGVLLGISVWFDGDTRHRRNNRRKNGDD